MCNCGNKRTSFAKQGSNTAPAQTQTAQPVKPPASNAVFEYTGKTALTVMGSITGRRYRFNRTGDVQTIDVRDASGMMGVPVLKKRA